jgi:hypothetical protein
MLTDASNGYRNPSPKIQYDIVDIKEIISLDETQFHGDVDVAIIETDSAHKVPMAIVPLATVQLLVLTK